MVAALVLAALAGCGEGDDRDRAPSLPAAPAGVVDGCREAAEVASFGVLCPSEWPAPARPSTVRLNKMIGRDAYLLEAQEGFGNRSPVFHVLFGGQRRPFPSGFEGGGRSLRVTTRRVTIPMRGGGRFVQQLPTRRIGTTEVHGLPAAILRAPPYPRGGIHGDHTVVMWNEDGHGYLVSTHSETSRRAATRTAIQIARSTRAD